MASPKAPAPTGLQPTTGEASAPPTTGDRGSNHEEYPMSHDLHPVKVRASVRGLDHDDRRITPATLLYDAIVHQRRFTEDDKVSHVAGCVLDVSLTSAPDDITHLASSIFMVATFPLDFGTYRGSATVDVGEQVARALANERFGGGSR